MKLYFLIVAAVLCSERDSSSSSSSRRIMEDLRQKCEAEWGLQGVSLPLPPGLDWSAVHEAKPFCRNLLKNPSPYGLTKDAPPPEPDLPEEPDRGPPRFIPEGDFSGWKTSSERLPTDTSGIPEGAVICHLPQTSWFVMEQEVDLKAEGLWDELLDEYQPEIVIEDWYEETQLHKFIYQLHVQLLGADRSVIAEHRAEPEEELSVYSHNWKQVSHVFSGYGPGVRFVHFVHRLKNQFLNGFWNTMFTGSSVTIRPKKRHRDMGFTLNEEVSVQLRPAEGFMEVGGKDDWAAVVGESLDNPVHAHCIWLGGCGVSPRWGEELELVLEAFHNFGATA